MNCGVFDETDVGGQLVARAALRLLFVLLVIWVAAGCGGSTEQGAVDDVAHVLVEAVEARDLAALQSGVASHAELLNVARVGATEIGTRSCVSPTALVLAAAYGWDDGVEVLIAAGADVDGVDGQRRTPLEWAAGRTTSVRSVEMLLEAGADPNHANEFGATPLQHAAWNRSDAALEMVRMLVEAGASVAAGRVQHMTPLTAAIESQQLEVVSYLLSIDASDLNARSVDGMTPLLLSIELREDAIAELLLSAGADTRSATPGMGHSALHQLCARRRRGGAALAQVLLSHGADPNARDIGGHTPLMIVGGSGDAALVAALVEGGADPWAEDDDGLLAMDFALRVDDVLVGQALVDAMMVSGVDPSGQSRAQQRIRQAIRSALVGPLGPEWQVVLDSMDGSFLIDD